MESKMANMYDLVRNAGDGLRNIRDSVVNEHDEQTYFVGYAAAAEISTAVLSRRIDGLLAKMEAPPYASPEEQFLLANLIATKAEIEENLRE